MTATLPATDEVLGTTGDALATGVDALAAAPCVPMSELRRGALARVVGLDPTLPRSVSRRLADLGFTADTEIECVCRAPLGSPTIYRVGESRLCLRRGLCEGILVEVTR
jgi:ferrous iron transport protein A